MPSMFKSIEELKSFIIWAKQNQLSSVKVGEFQVEISQIGILESSGHLAPTDKSKPIPSIPKTEEDEDEDLLFWSSNN
jgi:hypothetical protein